MLHLADCAFVSVNWSMMKQIPRFRPLTTETNFFKLFYEIDGALYSKSAKIRNFPCFSNTLFQTVSTFRFFSCLNLHRPDATWG